MIRHQGLEEARSPNVGIVVWSVVKLSSPGSGVYQASRHFRSRLGFKEHHLECYVAAGTVQNLLSNGAFVAR